MPQALPLLLTSRPAEYAAAVAETDVLTSAAAIELTDLTLDDLANYLPRTTRKPGRADPAANAWDPVLTTLREQPPDQPASPLAAILANPLMVALARTIYSDIPEHDPAELLDTARFGSSQELEDHLLDHFIPTVYRRRPPQAPGARPRPAFDPERARHWLGYLAHHLNRLETPDLAWWRLGSGLRRSTRTLVTALVTGLAIGLVDCASSTAAGNPFPIVDGTIVGLLSGLMFGLVHWLTFAVKDKPLTPSVVRLQNRRRPGTIQWKTGPRLVIGMLGGLVFGSGYGSVVGGVTNKLVWKAGLSTALHDWLVDAIVFGLVFSGGAGLTFCLVGLLESPLDIRSADDPRSLLSTNRSTVTTQLLVWAATFGAVVGFGSGAVVDLLQEPVGPLVWSPRAGLVLGTISGLGSALGYALTMTAWGQWLVLSRIWLPLTGRLPWAVVTFLDDACQRGVLRQVGAVYQFRHARLQGLLAGQYKFPVQFEKYRNEEDVEKDGLPFLKRMPSWVILSAVVALLLFLSWVGTRDILGKLQTSGNLGPSDAPIVVTTIVSLFTAIGALVGGTLTGISKYVQARGQADAERTRADADMLRAQAEIIRAKAGSLPLETRLDGEALPRQPDSSE
ncbi:hypothetical protein OG905_00530 [Streptomyces sp. NBC_00322]|uniref:hypothetical protein n=1 Tax=Streptomyces sp. NBC_00322 TaxID=2975712 RepID=UPI002E2CFA5F|nr:hypothetical protein [Streptomyces sp. NBC_00322]